MISKFPARIQELIRRVRVTYARWRTIRAFRRKNPQKVRRLSTGGIEVLSLHFDGMPTGRTVAFSPLGIAVITAGIDDKFGRDDTPDRLFPPISESWKDEELPSTPEALREANVDRIVALRFCDRERIITKPAIDENVLMTYNDETGEQVMLIIPITDILGRLRMGEDYRNIPPVEGAEGLDWWAELRRRYPKETFWVPRQYRH